jgi:hypothetical protein
MQVGVARHVAAERADRLRQRADLDVDAPVHLEVVDGAAAVLPNTPLACASSTIMMQPVSSARSQSAGSGPEVAVHAEDAVGDEQLALRCRQAP